MVKHSAFGIRPAERETPGQLVSHYFSSADIERDSNVLDRRPADC
jgi:hypothetical protein